MEGLEVMAVSSWKHKKVLVTGNEGFLGTHLTKRLISYGAKVVGLDIKTRRARTFFHKDDLSRFVSIQGSVANSRLVGRVLKKYNFDFVFHLAAEAIVTKCYVDPLRTFSSNIRGTWTLLEACRHAPGIESIVIASSDKAYGAHDHLPYEESTPLKGMHPYDVSKSCADLLAAAYAHTFKVPVVITRCGNIFGPGEFNFSRIVPHAVTRILSGKPVLIRSDGNFTRDYVYVSDIVDGYLLLAQKTKRLHLAGQAFNFSNESPLTVLELVKRICRAAGTAVNCQILNKAKYEIRDQYLSAKKARRILGWRPRVTLDEGLIQTLRWYRHYARGKHGR